MTVGEALQQSREAHARYRHAAGHIDGFGKVSESPNNEAARLAVVDAMTFRRKAEGMDPTHDDPAWSEDTAQNRGVPSAKMLKFYQAFFTS